MPRKLSAPKHPEYFARVISALRLATGQLQPQNSTERGLLDNIRARTFDAPAAARLLTRFDAIPRDERLRVLGPLSDGVALPEPSPTSSEGGLRFTRATGVITRNRPSVFERWVARGRSTSGGGASSAGGAAASGGFFSRLRDELRPENRADETYDPEVSRDVPVYNVRYQGLYCKEETDGPGSDEIFVTTAVVTANEGLNFEGKAVNHPRGYPGGYHGNVDSGDERPGPVVSLWRVT